MTYQALWHMGKAEAHRLSDVLLDHGANATDLMPSDIGPWAVTAYFESRPNFTRIRRVVRHSLGYNIPANFTELVDQDWVAASQSALRPVRQGRFLVHGDHDRDKPHANDIAIEINAAMAFGTGHHGSTLGCLGALQELRKYKRIRSALDVGTGSGVLAIAAAKSWRTVVVATDIDPIAVAIAEENARLNRVARRIEIVRADGLRHMRVRRRRPYDLVVANILSAPLRRLARPIATHLNSSGALILSGLLPKQGREVTAAYRTHGLAFRRALIVDGWLTLLLQRPQR